MPAVPINSPLLSSCGMYQTPTTAKSSKLCREPAEGFKFVPMQFAFNEKPGWLVDLSVGSPNPPLSQCCALFVDTSNCQNDVNILFPDSGYQVRVKLGGGQLVPVLTGTVLPKFYVLSDNGGNTNSDICNVFAMNKFVPEFQASNYVSSIAYGYGQYFSLQPLFAQSVSLTATFDSFPSGGVNVINHTQWYLNNLQVDVNIEGPADAVAVLQLFDDTTEIYRFHFTVGAAEIMVGQLVQISGLNYISSGNGPLVAKIPAASGFSSLEVTFNIAGGILIT